jgi:hypothetical protein
MQPNQERPLPFALAMLLAEAVHRDLETGKETVLGILSVLSSRSVPVRIRRLCVYIHLTDGRAKTPLTLRIVDADEERPSLFVVDGVYDFANPTEVMTMTIAVDDLVFPEFGEYRVQLQSEGATIMERRLIVRNMGVETMSDKAYVAVALSNTAAVPFTVKVTPPAPAVCDVSSTSELTPAVVADLQAKGVLSKKPLRRPNRSIYRQN